MNKSKIFIRTDFGNKLLGVPYGNISGDARRLLALIDGSNSIEGIEEKVPLSVQVQLDAIFAELLTERLIAEKAGTGSDFISESSGYTAKEENRLPVGPQSIEDGPVSNRAGKESKRRTELDHELAGG